MKDKIINNNEHYMQLAIKQALKAYKRGDVPIGAVIVKNNKVISSAYNKKNKNKNALYHSEILAINKACKKVKNFRLTGCTIYVTKEPCLMCLGALLSARIDKIVFGSYDDKYSNLHLLNNVSFNHSCEVIGGVCQNQTGKILTDFFTELRQSKNIKD